MGELKPKRLTRQYLFGIISSVDSEFLPAAIKEVELRRMGTGAHKKTETVEVNKHMLHLLQQFATSRLKSKKRGSLSRLKVGSKKRKLAQVREADAITTRIRVGGHNEDADASMSFNESGIVEDLSEQKMRLV